MATPNARQARGPDDVLALLCFGYLFPSLELKSLCDVLTTMPTTDTGSSVAFYTDLHTWLAAIDSLRDHLADSPHVCRPLLHCRPIPLTDLPEKRR